MLNDVTGIFPPSQLQGDAAGPITRAFSVTPSNTLSLPRSIRGVMVTGGGAIAAHFVGEPNDNTTVVFPGLIPGQIYPFSLDKIIVTGTTATGIVGLE